MKRINDFKLIGVKNRYLPKMIEINEEKNKIHVEILEDDLVIMIIKLNTFLETIYKKTQFNFHDRNRELAQTVNPKSVVIWSHWTTIQTRNRTMVDQSETESMFTLEIIWCLSKNCEDFWIWSSGCNIWMYSRWKGGFWRSVQPRRKIWKVLQVAGGRETFLC